VTCEAVELDLQLQGNKITISLVLS